MQKRIPNNLVRAISLTATIMGLIIIIVCWYFPYLFPSQDIILVIGGALLGFITMFIEEFCNSSVERAKAYTENKIAENERLKAEKERVKAENERIKAEQSRIENKLANDRLEQISNQNAELSRNNEALSREIRQLTSYPIEQKQKDAVVLGFIFSEFGGTRKGELKNSYNRTFRPQFPYSDGNSGGHAERLQCSCNRLGVPIQPSKDLLDNCRKWGLARATEGNWIEYNTSKDWASFNYTIQASITDNITLKIFNLTVAIGSIIDKFLLYRDCYCHSEKIMYSLDDTIMENIQAITYINKLIVMINPELKGCVKQVFEEMMPVLYFMKDNLENVLTKESSEKEEMVASLGDSAGKLCNIWNNVLFE